MNYKITEELKQKILDDYKKGMTKIELERKHLISMTSICMILKGTHIPRKFMPKELKQQIINDYISGYPYDTMVLKYGLSKQKLYHITNGYSHLQELHKNKPILTDADKKQIIEDYRNGVPFKVINDKYYISRYELYNLTSDQRKERKAKVKSDRIKKIDRYDNYSEIPFAYSHTGLDGQKVYKFIGNIKNRNLYIELIDYSGEWVYHCENNKGLVCDSRISNRRYNSLEDCKIALFESLERKKYFKK